MEDTREVQATSDYKLDKRGKKFKAHRLVFNQGEDDGKKGVSEQMKKTFNTFVEQHTLELTEEQLNQLEQELNEVLGKDAQAGAWIHDFVHSDNPKFAGKSKEKRKQMALAAYYSKQNEEVEIEEALKGGQVKLDKNKNGTLDKQDFKMLRKEDLDEALHPEADKVLKHIKPEHRAKYKPDLAKGVYKGDFADRTAVLKAAKAAGHLNEDAVDESTVPEHMKGKQKPYVSSDGKGGHEVLGNVGQVKATFTQKEHGKDAKANAIAHLKKNYDAYMKEEIDEAMWPGTPEYKKKFDTDRVTGAGARHDIKKTATGVIATRRFSDNDTAEKPKDAPKRGRGRPKKDKFAEAVEFLMSLDETTFDSFMEEGFDTFMESFENLDEVSKTTLGSYIKKASRDATITRKIGADFEHQANKARSPGMKAASTSLADKWKSKSWKRSHNIDKAVDRLSK
jgi:hypothetical protein